MIVEFEVRINTLILAAHSFELTQTNSELRLQRLGHVENNKFLELKNKWMVKDLEETSRIISSYNLFETFKKS